MRNNLERFTPRARRVLSLAQEEAERMQHSSIGTGHLLIGLMRDEISSSVHLLRDLGFQLGRVRRIVETQPPTSPAPQNIELSAEAKQVLQLAVDEARKSGHLYISIEHLLLAMVGQNEGVMIDMLKQYHTSTEQVRLEIKRTMQTNPDLPTATQPDEGNSPT
jgi:ATP-dependent Clp protease ATP-binding subunit ClpC